MAVRLVTNPGSNLSPSMVERYSVQLTPQQIIVEWKAHDTRQPIDLSTVDGWVASAKEHPHVVGSTAAEHAQLFRQLVREGDEVIVLTTSKKVIQTYDAARTATRSVQKMVSSEASIRVVDCGLTDLGVALAAVMAGEALEAGRSSDEVVSLLTQFAQSARMVWTLESLDYAVKGGRSTGLRAFLANLLRIRPVLGFVDGEVQTVAKMRTRDDATSAILDELAGSIPEGARIALAAFHGDAINKAKALADAARERYEVEFSLMRPLSPSIYLYSGQGTVGLAAVDLDSLAFVPPTPPPFAD